DDTLPWALRAVVRLGVQGRLLEVPVSVTGQPHICGLDFLKPAFGDHTNMVYSDKKPAGPMGTSSTSLSLFIPGSGRLARQVTAGNPGGTRDINETGPVCATWDDKARLWPRNGMRHGAALRWKLD